LLITEAGGMVSDMQGTENYVKSGHICAGNPFIHPQLLEIIKPHLTSGLKA
jgi:myo-inositol-1(or 4)-monophosphatase